MLHRLVFLFGWIPWLLSAQPAQSGVDLNKPFYATIEARLEQPGGDTARQFILQEVRKHCGADAHCQFEAYSTIMINLERRFNLPMAVFVVEEMVKLAQRQGNLAAEARAYVHLDRYHSALGNNQLAFNNNEKALQLYEQLNDQVGINRTKFVKLIYSLSYRKLAEVLPEMEAVLEKSLQNKDTVNASQIYVQLVQFAKGGKMYDKMERYVAALEKFPVSTPLKPTDYYPSIHAALGRAELLMVRKDFGKAEQFFQKALKLSTARPDHWLAISSLHALSELEWNRGNTALAKSYLDAALQKAEKLEMHELLVYTFSQKAKIAEAEGRFADALAFTKKQQFHDENFKSRSAGFNMERYFLQQEKDRLATEKKNQDLELQIKKSQLRNSLLITALVILLTIGLLVGLQRLRKAKQELAAQNALIQQQSEQLKSLDAAKSRFFANVSHELRTPLTLMLGPIQSVLKDSNLSERQSRLLNTAHQSGKGLQALVNEILDLQKLEAGKMELLEKPTALVPFFGRYAAQFESLAQRKEVDFSFETNLDKSLVAYIDQEKCRQVLYNLLSNAFKFTPAGGKVKLEIRKLEIEKLGNWEAAQFPNFSISNFQISVSDTGPGIHPDDLPHLFERYFQTTRPDKPAEGGTGIGLSLCHEYAKLFGGKIEVESAISPSGDKEVGSVFRITFPVRLAEGIAPIEDTQMPAKADAVAPTTATSQAKPSVNDASKPTILVVEDNPELQDYIRLVLEEKYRVITAGNGQVALKVLQSAVHCPQSSANGTSDEQKTNPLTGVLQTEDCGLKTVDLILSDLMMPVMDGYQLLEKLKSDDATRHLPVIMLTARAEARDRLKALRIGVDDYLTKPFDEEELLVRIENLLANSRNRQAALDASKLEAQVPLPEPKPQSPTISEPDRVWLENFEAFVYKNLANDLLSVPYLAKEFAMSESTLLRQLKRLTGLSTVQYLQEIRLHQARHFLENRSLGSIANVATSVGYSDVGTFSKTFKQRFGKSPSDYLSD